MVSAQGVRVANRSARANSLRVEKVLPILLLEWRSPFGGAHQNRAILCCCSADFDHSPRKVARFKFQLKGGKDPHPQDFSLTKKTARFTKGRFRPY